MKLDSDSIEANFLCWTKGTLVKFITEADRLYWEEAKPEISDALFDRLVNRLREIAPNHKLLKNVGLRLGGWGSPVTHDHPMLSLEKCRTVDELLRWAKKKGEYYTITPKVDGVAISLHYNNGKFLRAVTRGDGSTGEDVSTPVRRLVDIPMQIQLTKPIEIRGELYFPCEVFPQYADRYISPRNAVAGYLKNQKIEEILPLRLYPYDAYPKYDNSHSMTLSQLHSFGFPCSLRWEGADLQTIFEKQDFPKLSQSWPFSADGLVVRVNDHEEFDDLGTTAHHPRGAIAFKFADTSIATTLQDITWETSRTGAITPVAIFAPVEVAGASLNRATLHNLGRFRALQLSAGCTLEVTRRGGVIPQVERVIKKSTRRRVRTFEPPDKCPSCDEPTIEVRSDEGVFLSCESNSCPSKQINRLIHYAKTIGMKGFGPKVVKILFEEKRLIEFGDFYNGSSNFWAEFVGPGVATNLEAEVQTHLKIPLAVFLTALGIPNLGTQTARIVTTKFKSLNEVRRASTNDLQDLPGIGDITGGEIHEGLFNFDREIRFLLQYINILPVRSRRLGWKGPQSPLRGKTVCFTGSMSGYTKKQLSNLASQKGAEVVSSVTRELDILVELDPTQNSSKSLKAVELRLDKGTDIQIIPGTRFLEMTGVDHVP
jgi:DNA ligase (NAD+)